MILDRNAETRRPTAKCIRAPEFFIRALVLLCTAFPVLATPDWSTLNRGIVKVEAAKSPTSDTGVGIVIAASSDSIRILTAAHVVADARAWKVYFYSDQTVAYTATVLPRSSDGLDLAVLEVRPQGRALPGNFPRMPMRERDTLAVDEHIWTVDSEWVHIANTAVRLDHDSDTRLFEYTKVAVDDGFSGGPVFDDDGRLVGVHRGGGAGGRYAVAAKLDSAIDALAALGHNTPNLARAGAIVSPPPQPPLRLADSVSEKKEVPVGTITIAYPGDLLGCGLYLNLKIGNKTFSPTSNLYSVEGVALGKQPYTVAGQIGCALAGMCVASGTGSIDVRDGASYTVQWANVAYASCHVALRGN